MKKKSKPWKSFLIIVMILSPIIALTIFNFLKNEKFFEAPLTTCISLVVAILLSFYVVQRKTDLRKQKDIFIQLLESFKNLVDDEKSYIFNNITQEEILMRKRDMNNKFLIIKNYSKKFSISDNDILFIEERCNEYISIIDNHLHEIDILKKLHTELERPLNLISQKIFEIILNLYD